MYEIKNRGAKVGFSAKQKIIDNKISTIVPKLKLFFLSLNR